MKVVIRNKSYRVKKTGILLVLLTFLLIIGIGTVSFGLIKGNKDNKEQSNKQTTAVEEQKIKEEKLKQEQEEQKQKKYDDCMEQPYKMETLEQEFNQLFDSYKDLDLAISFRDVKNDYVYFLNPNKGYYSGCIVKPFSVIYLVQKARAGELSIHDTLTYKPEDKHQFSDYTDKHNFYDEIPIIDLIRYMFTTSDNSAYFIIMRSYGADTFNQYFKEKYNINLHFTNRHPFEGSYTTATSDKLLQLLYELLQVDDEATKVMKEALYNDVENTVSFDDIKLMHKYGEYDKWHNDIGIYEGNNQPYLVSIFTTRALTDYKTMIPKVSKDLYTIYKKNIDSKEAYCKIQMES